MYAFIYLSFFPLSTEKKESVKRKFIVRSLSFVRKKNDDIERRYSYINRKRKRSTDMSYMKFVSSQYNVVYDYTFLLYY
jgi:hypothetical protein